LQMKYLFPLKICNHLSILMGDINERIKIEFKSSKQSSKENKQKLKQYMQRKRSSSRRHLTVRSSSGISSGELSDYKEESSQKKQSSGSVSDYNKLNNKLIDLCKSVDIPISYVRNYDKFINICNRKKRHIIKEYSIKIGSYSNKLNYKNMAGTYIIESIADEMISTLRTIDKIIELLNKRRYPVKNKDIRTLMGIKHFDSEFLEEELV